MTEKDDILQEEDLTAENLKGAGQRIIGNLEIIGGIITGDPVTTAEGEFNDSVGKAHQDSARILTETEHEES
ncbi:MAG TPA: hypothetical protein VF599_06925 [Pyrinomonadaceae bacterium]|jgi:hypothetical protein